MIDWFKRLPEKPAIAHLMRAGERFTVRLGSQFGAAITYFSVLALVPIAMLGFSFVGIFLVVLRPDLIPVIAEQITAQLRNVDEATIQQVEAFIVNALSNWAAIGIIGLVSALYAGANWMNNLKDAINAQWRAEFDEQGRQPNIVLKTLASLVELLGLMVAIAVTFGLAAVSTALSEEVIGWLGLTRTPGLSLLFSLLPVVFSIGAGWLTFFYIYTVLPEHREPWPLVRRGALMGAVGLGVLQYLASFLIGIFQGNVAAQTFGPIIVLMFFFNAFASLILFIAAWIATYDEPALPEHEEKIRFAEMPTEMPTEQPAPEEPTVIPEHVAVRSLRIGTGAGYVTGAATGVGIGAVFALLAARIGRRRRR
jgi:membrane protein